MPTPILYETHMHTPLCKHAEGEPEDYAAVAQSRGLAGIIVTCHNPMPNGFARSVRMEMDEFDTYLEIVQRARRTYAGEIDVRLGIECDFFPGYEDFLAEQVAGTPFDYVLGSVHPQLPPYQRQFFTGDVFEFQRGYFTHLAEAAESGLFDCISHPDLVKNCFPDAWRLERILDHVKISLDRIAETACAMELNTSGLHKSISEFNPSSPILEAMRERDIPVVIGADAHVPARVAADYETAMDVLEAAGYESVAFFLERTMRSVPIAAARASLVAD